MVIAIRQGKHAVLWEGAARSNRRGVAALYKADAVEMEDGGRGEALALDARVGLKPPPPREEARRGEADGGQPHLRAARPEGVAKGCLHRRRHCGLARGVLKKKSTVPFMV